MLNEVIDVERAIRDRLLMEKKKAGELVDEVKKKAEKDIFLEEERIKKLFEQAIKDARLDTERKAHEIIANAAARSERLIQISDEELKRVIERHINKILPIRNASGQ